MQSKIAATKDVEKIKNVWTRVTQNLCTVAKSCHELKNLLY